jgi:hypothetical protein
MCRNGNTYPTRPNAENIAILSLSLNTSTVDCVQSGAYASPWPLFAAADALAITINSVYPPINSFNDLAYEELNTKLNLQLYGLLFHSDIVLDTYIKNIPKMRNMDSESFRATV